ncbi:MAG: hypothetical protein R3357_13415 [Burkholderiales bacterium]|nr:hypothetical protein [Burkholderiales bacterium]
MGSGRRGRSPGEETEIRLGDREAGQLRTHRDGHGIALIRLDRLDEAAKSLLGVASIIGRVFSERILERVHCDGASLGEALETLHSQEIIRQTRALPEPEYTFKHVLTREVAYEGLSHQRRKRLHELVAQAIEELYPERLDQNASILAYHYARSVRGDKAIHYALRAGEQAARLYANTEAATYYDDALALVETLPRSVETDGLRLDAILGRVAVGTGARADDDRSHLEQAYAIARELKDRVRTAKVLYWLGRNHYVAAELRRAIEYAEQSLKIADELGDAGLGAGPVNLMGRAYWQLADFARSAHMMERSVEQMALLGNRSEESTAAGFVSALFGYMGEFEKALKYSSRSIKLAKELKNPYAEAASFHYRGIIRDQQGEWDLAIADYATAQGIAGPAGDTLRLYLAKFMEGRALQMAGDHARSRSTLHESISLATSIGTNFLLGQAKTFLAVSNLAEGDVEQARVVCDDAIALAVKAGDKFTEALALHALSEVLRAPGSQMDLAKAFQSLDAAIRIQQQIRARPELGRSYASMARLAAAQGMAREADEHGREASRLFAELGMRWDMARMSGTGAC